MPFGLITQLVLLAEALFVLALHEVHKVFSSPLFFLLFSFLGNFLFMGAVRFGFSEISWVFSFHLYHIANWKKKIAHEGEINGESKLFRINFLRVGGDVS